MGAGNSDIVTFETGEATATPKSVPMPWEDEERDPPARKFSPASSAETAPSNLPRKRLFVGRAQEIAALEAALAAHGVVSIFGLAGSGKTALALALAHRAVEKNAYPGGVIWLSAEGTPIDATARLAPVLRAIGGVSAKASIIAIDKGASIAEIAAIVRLSLQSSRLPSLLVLDGVDAFGWPAHLPGGETRVLVTTRDERFAFGSRLPVRPMVADQANALARAIAGEPSGEPEDKALARVLDSGIAQLAAATEASARAVSRWARSWVDYERFMFSDSRALLEERDPQSDYGESVLACLDRSIDGCARATTARRLLEGAAVFAPDDVPLAWACSASELDSTSLDVKRALATLRGLGLCAVNDDMRTISMNRLVHRRVRERAEEEDFKEASQRGAVCVSAWLEEKVDPSRTAEVEARRAHVEEALGAADRGDASNEWLHIADRWSAHLRHMALYPEARSLLERAVSRAENLSPPSPARVAEHLSMLASLQKDLGQLSDARASFERALAIDERTFGVSHATVARDLMNLAAVMKDLGQAAEARPMLERALAIDEAVSGPEHPNTAKTLSTLATVLKDLGQPADARAYLERALAIDEKVHGPDHPSAVVRLTNLAMVLKDLGQAAEARPLLQRALMILEGTYGGEHPIVATSLTNLALVLKDLGQVVDAKQHLMRAHRIAEKTLPSTHPTRQKIAAHLAHTAPGHEGAQRPTSIPPPLPSKRLA